METATIMLPINGGYWLMALLPILFLLTAIMKLGWSAARTAPISMALALLIAVWGYHSAPIALGYEALKGIWNAATILLVIWPAVFLFELTKKVNAFDVIRKGIQSLTRHELLQILILGWIFPSFLQGITGFGVAVAIGAPLLLSIGVSPLYSIIIVLLCHSWGATFGTLALAWEALVQQSGMDAASQFKAAILAAVMVWIFNLISVFYCCWMYGRKKAVKEIFPVIVILSFIMGSGQVLLAPVNSTVSFFIPTTLGLIAVFGISRLPRYRREWSIGDSPVMERKAQKTEIVSSMSFGQAFLPYSILTIVTIICLLIKPVNKLFSTWKISFAFPETVTGYGYVTAAETAFSPFKPLTYAGTFLMTAMIVGIVFYKKRGFLETDELRIIWKNTLKKCIPSTVAITSLIVMAKIMGSSGQIYVLSKGVVNILGRYYIMIAPVFGMIGAFITSSNMSSNILFGNFQAQAAGLLHVDAAVTCALQTTGGVLGDSFAPGCIIMGVSTTGYDGEERKILRKIMPIAFGCAIVYGVVFYLITTFV